LAAFHSPQGQYCDNCGAAIDPAALVCPNCRRFTHSKELEELATHARQLTAANQLVAARDLWLLALKLIPNESTQYQGVLREVEKLNRRISPPPGGSGQKTDWRKKWGPLGVVIAALAKFKTVGLLLATKGKLLLTGLLHYKSLLSILAFFGVYWGLYGWWFALGIVGSIFLHEMGHYIAVKRFGFAAELPVFLPGFGAYVRWQGASVEPGIRAQISLAGPLFGLISGLLAYGLFESTGRGVWLAVAHFAGWINLLNLIPVSIFDGGSAMNALGRQERMAVIFVSLALWFLLHENLFLFVAIGTGYRIWKKDFPVKPNHGIAYYYIGITAAVGLLSWYSALQARELFVR
jgi:Zn-dependent protease